MHIYIMHVSFRDKQQWHTSQGSKSSKQSPKNKFQPRKTSSVLLYTETKILNLIITLNNCMLVFDHLDSSLPTIFDGLFKPFNIQYSHNTRGPSRYVLNILSKMKTVNSRAILIIYKFYNCNGSKSKNYKIKSPLSLWWTNWSHLNCFLEV